MRLRIVLNHFRPSALLGAIVGAVLAAPGSAAAQEPPARRLASIVGVAVQEYSKGIDANGRLVSDLEYREAVDFLGDARGVAERLSGARAPRARAVLDTLIAAVGSRRPSNDVRALHGRFMEALGSEGALERPRRALDLAAGRVLYQQNCATCHGIAGHGDGPVAQSLADEPTAIGRSNEMYDVSPALMYRIVSVGIPGSPMPAWAAKLSADQRWDVVHYVMSLRATEAQVLQGEGLFAQRCAGCHGVLGGSDGAVARALTRAPTVLADHAWQTEHSDAEIAAAIAQGVPGTAMPAARDLTHDEVASVVAYLRTFPGRVAPTVAAADSGSADATATRVLAVLDEALGAVRAGRASDAGDRAFDAYIAFEPLETTARAKSPGLVASMERHFADFKGAARQNDLRGAERARDAIAQGLPQVVALTQPAGSGWGAFLQSFLIILREGFEAILVIGAVVAFLVKTGNRARLRSIWLGVGLALAASAATAVVIATALRALPATREIIEGVTMLVAVAVLFSVSYWLISKVEAARWQQFIREKVNDALAHGGGRALTVVAFLAVYREGAETALFYQALFDEGQGVAGPIALGLVAGAAALVVLFTLFYRYGVKIPMRPFFAVTSGLLYYMAFVFMGKGIRELQEGNVVGITVLPGFPSVEAMGIFPSVETLLAQLVLVALFVFAIAKTFWPKRSVALPTVTQVIRTTPAPLAPGADVLERLARLQDAADRLERRLDAIEEAVGSAISATTRR
ncbi:MAG: FTR1 family protein [Gemmatimonadaceae bacterium]